MEIEYIITSDRFGSVFSLMKRHKESIEEFKKKDHVIITGVTTTSLSNTDSFGIMSIITYIKSEDNNNS